MLRHCCWCALFVLPLAAQPWDILGSRTIVTPFSYAGEGGAALAPNGDVFIAVSPCGAPGIVKLTSYGTPAPCDTVVARVNPAGNLVYAIQLGGVDDGGPVLLLDPAGNIIVSGQTSSPSRFHPTPGAYLATPPETNVTGFVCKLAAADGTPIFCTFLDQSAMVRSLDAAGDLLFTLLVSSTTSGDSYAILKIDQTGSKLVSESVPVAGVIGSIVQNSDGTFFLSGESSPSGSPPMNYYGKFDPNAGFLFAQDLGTNSFFAVASSVGPLLAGNVGAGFEVRQYAADGVTIVYDRTLPLFMNGRISIVDGGVALTGFVTSAALPLVHNLHPCGQISGLFSGDPVMIRLDQTGAIVQTTWLRSNTFGNLIRTTDGGWSAIGSFGSSSGSTNLSVQVVSVGPSPVAQTETIGCMADLARGTRNTASPGLLIALTIDNEALIGPAVAQADASGRFPSSLAGMTLSFDGVPAPLFWFNGQQLSAAVPFSIAGKSTTQMCLTYPSMAQSCAAVQVVPFTPAVFGNVVNQDGTINSASHPAPPGSILSFYMVGLGPLSPGVPDGTIVGTPLPALTAPVQVEFASGFANLAGPFSPPPPPTVAQVTYAGPAPFEVAGLYQVNVQVPSGVLGMVTILVGPVGAPVASVNVTVVLGMREMPLPAVTAQ